MAPLVTVAARVRVPDLAEAKLTVPLRGQYGTFEFDVVCDETTSQETVFKEIALPYVNNFLQVWRYHTLKDLQRICY